VRLVTYTFRGTTRLGALLGEDRVVDLNRACARVSAERGDPRPKTTADYLVPPDMRAFLEAGQPAMDWARTALAAAEKVIAAEALATGLVFETSEPGFRLEAPVPRPGKILAVGLNYRKHAAETGQALPERPSVFTKTPNAIVGPGAPVLRPKVSTQLDWEGELCVVIGRRARHVPASRALEHVAGWMNGCDVSVRDWQRHSKTMIMGKGFETCGPTGPWLVTRDEVPDPGALELRTWVNGELMQEASTADLIFDVPALIEYLSQAFTLEPGDVLFTGTPAGVGAARTPPRFLGAGDVVRVEIGGLGGLENPVVDE
jgi:2-keto-4-pentenoate hydratase/2-oxohepta-3-ene-1,7-dioic acid hydratase in catechol pathway